MRALILTVAAALLLYGASLFSRDRESPRWARVADSARQEDQPARFESLTDLVKSVDDMSTGSVELRERPATPPPAAPEYALQSTTAAPVRVEKRLTPKRTNAANSNSGRWQGQRRQVARAAQAPSSEEMAGAPSSSERGSQTATPIEYSLADRGN
jgi:hypothetical protein